MGQFTELKNTHIYVRMNTYVRTHMYVCVYACPPPEQQCYDSVVSAPRLARHGRVGQLLHALACFPDPFKSAADLHARKVGLVEEACQLHLRRRLLCSTRAATAAAAASYCGCFTGLWPAGRQEWRGLREYTLIERPRARQVMFVPAVQPAMMVEAHQAILGHLP